MDWKDVKKIVKNLHMPISDGASSKAIVLIITYKIVVNCDASIQ